MNWDEGLWDQSSWDSPSSPTLPTLPSTKHTPNKTMASNPTPRNIEIALALADRMADGCNTHEVALDIKANTEVKVRASITDMTTAQMQLGAAKAGVGAASSDLKDVDAAQTTVLRNCRLRLVNQLGQAWNPAWEATGFPDQSTAVPEEQEKRLTLLNKLSIYFTNNPARESADLGATAALCTAGHTALSDAIEDLDNARTNQSSKINARDAAFTALRKRIRGLIEELDKLISPDDPRWQDFGLVIPANPSAPEAITSLTLTAVAGGKAHAEWSYATRMTGTRLMTKRTTGTVVDPDFISAGTVEGLEKTLAGFEPGTILQMKAIPYNEGGDGPASPVQQITILA
jgi:hypothetical protein